MFSRQHSFTLHNGLQVVVFPTPGSTMAVVNLMYHVGSAYEDQEHTGMAHFLEHIMFGGSKHIPSYDMPLQQVGGNNNAYTSNDVTNYWCKLPANKLEVAFWLESDRMLAPAYKESVIETQRKVVIEEFKQGCKHTPYGDVWHLLCEQAYNIHPYAWPTIGKDISHIARMNKASIVAFGNRFYTPENAILVVTGGVDIDTVHQMAEKWFGPIPSHNYEVPILPQEPKQMVASHHAITKDVPQNALYKTYHIPGRSHPNYAMYNILTNVLSQGKSSLLHHALVEEKALFSTISSYTSDSIDPGLFLIQGRLQENVTFEKAESALQEVIQGVIDKKITNSMIQKAIHQEEATYLFAHIDTNQQAETLAYATLLQDVDFFHKEIINMKDVTAQMLQSLSADLFQPSNSHTLHYAKIK